MLIRLLFQNNVIKMSQKKVIIIGAGLGGLSAAIHLRLKDFDVQIFEQNSCSGGKMNEYRSKGYRFDTGPSLLTMPFVVDEIFDSAGKKRNEFFEIEPVEPICRYFWEDGQIFNAYKDNKKMNLEISKISSKDQQNYQSFLEYSKRIYDLTEKVFLRNPIHELKNLFQLQNLPLLFNLFQIDPFSNMHESISKFFSHPKLIQIFDRYATYNGSNPYKAPATLNIIPFVECGLGGFYIKGGMYKLATSLEKLARDLGIEFQYNKKVNEIINEQGKVKGIRVAGGKIMADYVVCNSDVVTTYQNLIKGYSRKENRLKRLEPSLSGMVFLWGVAKRNPQLSHHNIVFSNDYREEFRNIFEEKKIAKDPTVYISISSKSDRDHAPPQKENWFVLLNMPYLANGQDWNSAVERLRSIVVNKLKKIGVELSDSIEVEKVYTPESFLQLYGSNKGSIYGISSNKRSTAFRRPPNRSREIEGLYFAGGSTHPGGGVPLVLLSGKITAGLIASQEKPL
jgi:phytoene desaturase